MIKVTKLDGQAVYVAADLIETVEGSPDTSIVLQGGRRYVVAEPVEEVVRRVVEYKRAIHSGTLVRGPDKGSGAS